LGVLQALRTGLFGPDDVQALAGKAKAVLPGRASTIEGIARLTSNRKLLAQNLALGIRELAIKEGCRLASTLGTTFEWDTHWDRPFAAFEALEGKLLSRFDDGAIDGELVADFSQVMDALKGRIHTDPSVDPHSEASRMGQILGRIKAELAL
jgi:hypothetical protein